MDEDSTTGAGNNLDDATTSTQDSTTTTEQQTGNDADNLDTSTEQSSAGDDSEEGSDDSATSQFDEDLDDWAEKRNGVAPETDAERRALQDLRNSQREYTRTHQAKKQSDKINETVENSRPKIESSKDDTADPLEKSVKNLESQLGEERSLRMRAEYLGSQEVTDEEVTVMGDILKEKVDKATTPEAKEQAFKFWTDPANLQDWHDLAKARLLRDGVDTQGIADEAAKKERERIAKESKANGSSRNAKTTTTSDKTLDQERLERFKNW